MPSPVDRAIETISPGATVMGGLGFDVVPFQPTLRQDPPETTHPLRTIETAAAWASGIDGNRAVLLGWTTRASERVTTSPKTKYASFRTARLLSLQDLIKSLVRPGSQ